MEVRIPILEGDDGPLRLSQVDKEKLKGIHSFLVKLKLKFRGASLSIFGPDVRVTLPIPEDFEEFESIIVPLANRVRTILILWSDEATCYLDLCANLLPACENYLVIWGDEGVVDEIKEIWERSAVI